MLSCLVPWSLVTAPDELQRCMVEIDGHRCEQVTAWRVKGEAWDEYALVCGDHVELVREPGMAVERVPGATT